MRALAILTAALALTPAGYCAEGKWTPEQVLALDRARLTKMGLEIPPERLWNAQRGAGLLAATINIGGCSAAFVSESGLILTNHHCLFGVVQEHSRPERNLIDDGFLARSRGEELPSKTLRATVPHKFTDVTRAIEAAVPGGSDYLQRQKAIEAKQKSLVAACEKRPFARCRVASFDGGVQYVLVDTTELPDVRLVYAPPRAVGEYGGEIDNFMWPRHTGDFSVARAYVAPNGAPATYAKENVPYRPEFFLPVAKDPVRAGDFVMVMGYPGRTFRSLTAAEIEERRNRYYPTLVDVYGEAIRILEESTRGRQAGEIAVAARLKSLHNTYKNAQGQIAGLDRGRIPERHRAAEEKVLEWARLRPEYKGAVAARGELLNLVAARERTSMRDFLLTAIPRSGSRALAHAMTVVRAAGERQKPDAERDTDFQDRMMPQLRSRLDREQAEYDIPADKALLAAWLRRYGPVPGTDDLDSLLARTRVTDREERLKMLGETPQQLKARQDPLLDVAFALEPAVLEMKNRDDRFEGAVSRLRPLWRRAVMAHAGKPVAPDANSTLRVSFAHVNGYSPRDAVVYEPFTTLAGLLEKNTGQEPFALPAPVAQAAKAAHPDLHVNFLADADTSGGNSGSPVVNGRGQLVGLNFDRVWENVANDFGYNPEIARNVNVDIGYFIWMLDKVAGARELLGELFGAGQPTASGISSMR